MSLTLRHISGQQKGCFHDLLNVETAFSVGERALNGGGSCQHHLDIYF